MRNYFLFIVFIFLLLTGLFIYKLRIKEDGLKKNKHLPHFTFENYVKKKEGIVFDSYNKLPTIIGFLSFECSTCISFINSIKEKNEKCNYFLILENNSRPNISYKFIHKMDSLNIKILFAESRDISNKFGAVTPSTFLIYDEQGNLVKHYVGSINPLNFLE